MPNYIINIVTVSGSDQEVKRFRNFIAGENGVMDFQKIIPMPKELDMADGSYTDAGIEIYLTARNPENSYSDGEPKWPTDYLNTIVDWLKQDRWFICRTDCPNINLTKAEIDERIEWTRSMHNVDCVELGKRAVNNLISYGFSSWYHWRIVNWGTKWNAVKPEYDEDGKLSFDTAWGYPEPILEKIAELFPRLHISHEWYDEDLANGHGTSEWFAHKGVWSSYEYDFNVDELKPFENDILSCRVEVAFDKDTGEWYQTNREVFVEINEEEYAVKDHFDD